VIDGKLVDILHTGVVVAAHVQRLREDQADRVPGNGWRARPGSLSPG
jgi:hypothetical protein